MNIVLTQPNYAWLSKRVWKMPPYTLGILNACVKKNYSSQILDPNYDNMSEEDVAKALRKINPDVVAVSSMSTEYVKASKHMTAIIRKAVLTLLLF